MTAIEVPPRPGERTAELTDGALHREEMERKRLLEEVERKASEAEPSEPEPVIVSVLCTYGHLHSDGSRVFQRVGNMRLVGAIPVPGDIITVNLERYELLFRVFDEAGDIDALAVQPSKETDLP